MKKFLALALAALVAFTPLVAAAGGAGHQYKVKAPVRWVKGATTDSTSISQVFADVDTTAAINLSEHRPEMSGRVGLNDSTFVLIGQLTFDPSAAGDSMVATVQFSQDGTLWTTERAYVVTPNRDPFPLYRWTNTNADMNPAPYVRVILQHNDGSSQIVRTFTLRPIVFTEGAS